METGHGSADSAWDSTPDIHEWKLLCVPVQVWKLWRGLVYPRELAFGQADAELGQCYPQWVSTQHPEPKSQQRSTACPGTQLLLGFAVPAHNSKDPDGSKQTRDPFSLHPILPWGHKTSPNKLYLLIWKRHSINEDRRDKPHAERKTALTKNSTSNAIRSNEYFFNQKKKIKFRFLPSSPIFFLPLSAAIEVWEQKELCYRNTELYFLICEVGCLKAL